MTTRSWRWLHTRIEGLLSTPNTRIWRAFRDDEEARTPS